MRGNEFKCEILGQFNFYLLPVNSILNPSARSPGWTELLISFGAFKLKWRVKIARL